MSYQYLPSQLSRKKTSFNNTEERILHSVPITKYFNRHKNIKPSSKSQCRLEVSKDRLIIKEQKSSFEVPQVIDTMLIFDIQKTEEIQKPENGFTLLKIQPNFITNKEECITFRVLNIETCRLILKQINVKMKELQNLPNYVDIFQKEKILISSIMSKQPEYLNIYNAIKEKRLLNEKQLQDLQEFMLEQHPEMKEFKCLKHILRYEQDKNILVEKIKLKKDIADSTWAEPKLNGTNIDRKAIEEDVQQNEKSGREWLEGYSSKKEFEGINITSAAQEQFYSHGLTGGTETLEQKRQNLILENIKLQEEEPDQNIIQDEYRKYIARKNSKGVDKMEIQQGQQVDRNTRKSYLQCKKIKIIPLGNLRLEQRQVENSYLSKSDVVFKDPSYSAAKEKMITKNMMIWCRIFYFYLKEGLAKREKLLSFIEDSLKLIKHSIDKGSLNEYTIKTIDRLSQNYLRLKRQQELY